MKKQIDFGELILKVLMGVTVLCALDLAIMMTVALIATLGGMV